MGKSSTLKGLGAKHGGAPKLPEIVGKDMLLAPQSQDATDGWGLNLIRFMGVFMYYNVSSKLGKMIESRSPWKEAGLYDESITMTMSSEDPYQDLRASMEEMVVAHELKEYHSLQELLNCYLRLNERKNHKVIVLAFVDLLIHLMDQDK
ncbi:hypothetical protein BHE74_00054335 [Ensete ventricosum]|nr:hypothetical protein GW17_00049464 [Ensete ventricosum]RWW40267.1 hypothetical protein BHE74_00054335 [Ensete ventricosum]